MLRQLTLFVTTRCQLQCLHCLNRRIGQNFDFPIDILQKIIGEAISFGINHVSLTGGEPILYPQFNELVECISKYNFTWSFVSNGHHCSGYLETISNNRKNFSLVGISIDGAIPETHNWLRNNESSFGTAIQSIKNYVDSGLRVWMKVCINKKNWHEIEAIVKLGEDLGVKGIRFAGIIPTKENKFLKLDEKESRCIVDHIGNLKNKTNMVIDTTSSLITGGGINICQNMQLETITLNVKGEMLYCCDTPYKKAVIGSAFENSLSSLLKKWLDISTNLQKKRVEQIAAGIMPDGFDSCTYCSRYFSK